MPRDAATLASIVYRSRAVAPWTAPALRRLLEGARGNNAAVGVTGVLVYDRDCFFQWLEGPQEALAAVMKRVRADPRHGDIEILVRQRIPSRLFPDWQMNLAQRATSSDATAEGRFTADAEALDELHVSGLRVQMVLASFAVPAWAATRPADGMADPPRKTES